MYCILWLLSALLLVVSSNTIPGADLLSEIIDTSVDAKPENDASFQVLPLENHAEVFTGPINLVVGALKPLIASALGHDVGEHVSTAELFSKPSISLASLKPPIALESFKPTLTLPSFKPSFFHSKPVIVESVPSKSLALSLPSFSLPSIKPSLAGVIKPITVINEKKLTSLITAKIVGPVVVFNSKIAAAAATLPAILAAKGAIIGAAIATPIEIGAVASSSIATGVTAKIVAIPVSLLNGATLKLAAAVKAGKKVVALKTLAVKSGAVMAKKGVLALGHILLKPIAIIAGTKAAVTGAGLGVAGTGLKLAGLGLQKAGSKMVLSGLKSKGAGALLIGLAFNHNVIDKHPLLGKLKI